MKENVNGKEIEFGDAIHNDVVIEYGWTERLKILFGKRSRVYLVNYTADPVKIIATTTRVVVDKLIKIKQVGLAQVESSVDLKKP